MIQRKAQRKELSVGRCYDRNAVRLAEGVTYGLSNLRQVFDLLCDTIGCLSGERRLSLELPALSAHLMIGQ